MEMMWLLLALVTVGTATNIDCKSSFIIIVIIIIIMSTKSHYESW